MKKAPEAFRTISEVSELLETPAHVLRFWESKFYQIRPVKRAGGRRYYRPDDVALINGIRILLQDDGLTIRGAQRILQDKGVRHVIGLGADLPSLGAIAETEALDPGAQDTDLPETDAMDEAPDVTESTGAETPPAAVPAPPPAAAPAEPPPRPAPVLTLLDGGDEAAVPAVQPPPPRLPELLRQLPRDGLSRQHDRLVVAARRIDALLDRMSEASGAGRW